MYVATIILILVYLITKEGQSGLRFVHIWREHPLPQDYELYIPEHLRERYEELHPRRRVDFDWFAPPN